MWFTLRSSDHLSRIASCFFHHPAAPRRGRGPGVLACGVAASAALLVSTFVTTANPAVDPSNTTTITYTKDAGLFCNPERGWLYQNYPKYGDPCSLHAPFTSDAATWETKPSTFGLNVTKMADFRTIHEAITMTKDIVSLGEFMNGGDLTPAHLARIQADWDEIRRAGMKVVARFAYSWCMSKSDASEETVSRHIAQLKPLLEKNADIIAWVEAGLIGGCGEGINSTHDLVDRHWGRSGGLTGSGIRVYKQLLDALPKDRMLVLRFPRYKWDMLGFTETTALANVLTESTAFDGTDRARLGYSSDGYMGNANHYAMFVVTNEKEFTKQDTGFTIFEGEASAATSYNMAPHQIIQDMTWYHQTGLSITNDDAADCTTAWKNNGDWDEITKRLGYRFFLVKATLPKKLSPGGVFELSMDMTNEGVARIMNPRGVEIILRNRSGGARYVLSIDRGRGNRLWLPGPGEAKTLEVSGGIPSTMPPGFYDVILNLPDPYPSIHDRPEYSIRLANQNMWESAGGYNKLNHTLQIDPSAAGPAYSGTSVFRKHG